MVFLELRRDSRVTTGISAFPLGWPWVSSDGNYSNIVTQDNRRHLVSFQLGQIEDTIGEQLGDQGSNFVRVGRKLIINTDYLFSIDITKQVLILSDCAGCYHELNASREVLIKMKAYFESLMTFNNEQTRI